ncbi:divergent PAP2 family protein [Metabacillus idriensis]|uniref:divergent PAP2 family protein n=1 Tax=Bacillaceae TaxID=186817 RepID=UPI000ACA22B5|nr:MULTISPECIES: divergent PAP2 family protein [Bacillaceae]MCM3596788.1 divergent PAP2 family protein [Metabacillus idriensis]
MKKKKKMNRGIITAISAIAIAQGLKVFTYKRLSGKWDIKQVVTTGGMPSSHSAGVAALSSYVAAKNGTSSIETAIAVIFGIIVMYDAQGIRRHTGEIAKLINDIDGEMAVISEHLPGLGHIKRTEELKEVLGHQPLEVVGGAVLGVLLGLASAKLEDA